MAARRFVPVVTGVMRAVRLPGVLDGIDLNRSYKTYRSGFASKSENLQRGTNLTQPRAGLLRQSLQVG